MIIRKLKVMHFISLLVAVVALPLSSSAYADWSLSSEKSQINFISIKKGSVGELHKFKKIEGKIGKGGKVNVVINLSSVDTGIPIRDERMKEFLFEVVNFPTAVIDAQLTEAVLNSVEMSQSKSMALDAKLTVHGKTMPIKVDVLVLKSSKDEVVVMSKSPFIVKAADFGFDGGINKLKELAGLPSIATAVPVSFILNFQRS